LFTSNHFLYYNKYIGNCPRCFWGLRDIKLNEKYDLINSNVKISSLISKETRFALEKNDIGYYVYKDIKFGIVDRNRSNPTANVNLKVDSIINVIFKVNSTQIEVIYELLERLYKIGIIFEK